MKKYLYANIAYETLDDVKNASEAMLNILQASPTKWCVVKRLQIADDNSFIVQKEELSDADILNLSDGFYSIYSPINGENIFGVGLADAKSAIDRLRGEFAAVNNVSVYTIVEEISAPYDFSAYL